MKIRISKRNLTGWGVKFFTFHFSFFVLLGCNVHDPIYETAHPQHGKITLTTDWSKMGEGITKPASYTIEIGEHKATANADKHIIEHLFDAGIYRGYFYNTAEHITVSNGIATVGVMTRAASTIEALPGWFFSASDEVEIKKDTHHEFTTVMTQQIRQLNIELTVTDGDINNIELITASLSGVANSMNLKTNSYSGTGLKVIPLFIRNGNKLSASVRLIGLTTEKQELILDIHYKGGANQHIISDISPLLASFNNNDKYKPLGVTGNMEIFTAIGIESTIKGWAVQDEIASEIEPK